MMAAFRPSVATASHRKSRAHLGTKIVGTTGGAFRAGSPCCLISTSRLHEAEVVQSTTTSPAAPAASALSAISSKVAAPRSATTSAPQASGPQTSAPPALLGSKNTGTRGQSTPPALNSRADHCADAAGNGLRPSTSKKSTPSQALLESHCAKQPPNRPEGSPAPSTSETSMTGSTCRKLRGSRELVSATRTVSEQEKLSFSGESELPSLLLPVWLGPLAGVEGLLPATAPVLVALSMSSGGPAVDCESESTSEGNKRTPFISSGKMIGREGKRLSSSCRVLPV
mmetsp:Transcript_78932/g.199234  ORF Transcript_78932/g.199234 Transcript_78932/m.199234 type:complete len:284 (+) Transcript_78932:129-980(+)